MSFFMSLQHADRSLTNEELITKHQRSTNDLVQLLLFRLEEAIRDDAERLDELWELAQSESITDDLGGSPDTKASIKRLHDQLNKIKQSAEEFPALAPEKPE